MSLELWKGRDVQIPIAHVSDITIQEIKGVFLSKLRMESCESSFNDIDFIETVAIK